MKSKKLHRHLGLYSVISISLGAMMGSGIFVLPLLAAEIAGPWVALSYLLAGFIVLPAMLSKAELATAMPVSGGTYIYLDRSMGPWMGTIGGLGTWLALSAKTAFALTGLGAYLVLFTDFPPLPFSLGVLAVLVALNIFGAGKASTLQLIIVVGSLLALAVFASLGFTTLDTNLLQPAFPHGASGILAGAGFVFVSYNGVTKVCSVAEEIVEPQKNIPLGMAVSLVLVMVLYSAIAIVITGNVDISQSHHDVTPVATAARAIFGDTGALVMAGVAVAGLISMCNAGVLATARFPFAMSRDGLMPDILAEVHPKLGTPAYAILFTAALLVALVTALPVYSLAKLASGFTIFIFGVENVAVMVLRETSPQWYRPSFTSPLYPWTQILGVLGCLTVLVGLSTLPMLGIAVAGILGTSWYFAYGKNRTTRTSALAHLYEAHVMKATEEAEQQPHDEHQIPRVIVPIFGDEAHPGRLARLAGAFADTGVLEVMRLEEVPEGMDLGHFLSEDREMERLSRQSTVLAEDLHLDVEFNDVLTHNAKLTLRDHAKESRAEWIVMEWPTRMGLRYLIRHPMAWWLDHPPCDLALFRDRTPCAEAPSQPFEDDDDLLESPTMEVRKGFSDILVLAEPGPYDTLLVHVADALALQDNARVTLLRVVPESADDAHVEAKHGYHQQLASLSACNPKSLVVRSDDHEGTVAKLTIDYDLLIIGAAAERGWRTLFFGSEEHRIADRASCSVLRLKAPQDQVHHRMPGRANVSRDDFALLPYLQAGALHAKSASASKEELFSEMAKALDLDGDEITEAGMLAAFWKREQHQNTAMTGGFALTAPVLRGLGATQLGVFTLAKPIDFHSRRRQQVDIVLAVTAPPEQRNHQLWLLDQLSEMVRRTDLINQLRQAEDEAAVYAAIEAAEHAIESMVPA